MLDLRAVFPGQDQVLVEAVAALTPAERAQGESAEAGG